MPLVFPGDWVWLLSSLPKICLVLVVLMGRHRVQENWGAGWDVAPSQPSAPNSITDLLCAMSAHRSPLHTSSDYCFSLLFVELLFLLKGKYWEISLQYHVLGYLWCKYLVSEEYALQNRAETPTAKCFSAATQWSHSDLARAQSRAHARPCSLVAAWHQGPALSTNHLQKAAQRERNKPGTLSAGLLMNDLADEQWKPSSLRSQASHFSSRWRFDFHCLPIAFFLA